MISPSILVSIVLTAAPLGAIDPDVNASPWSPTVRIEGERKVAPRAAKQSPTRPQLAYSPQRLASTSVRQSAPTATPTFYCAGQSAGELDCGRVPLVNFPDDPAVQPAPAPAAVELPEQLTEGRILRAVREIEMPGLAIAVQPGSRTLVNIPTILSATPRAVNRTVDLLGHEITVEAEATSFTWHHGDGTTQTTTRPGRAWPAKDVTHTYSRTAERVTLRVDTTYTVRYRVDDGAWSDLGQTLTATGPPTSIEVRQAAPVLTRP